MVRASVWTRNPTQKPRCCSVHLLPTRSRVIRLVLVFLTALTCVSSGAQSSPTIKVEVRLVRVPLSIADSSGAGAASLSRTDFTILDDGVPQDVRYLWRESDLPLTLGVVLDTSGTQLPHLIEHRETILRFLESVVRPHDQVFLVTFDAQVRLAVDLTSSPAEIATLIGRFSRDADSHPDRFGTRLGPPCIGHQHAYGAPCGNSVIWNALFYSAQQLQRCQGRKIMLLLTDGLDSGSNLSLDSAIREIVDAEGVVFAVGLSNPYNGKLNRRALTRITHTTGGMALLDGGTLESMLDRINQTVHSQVVLGYYPHGTSSDVRFHRLKVLAPSGFTVHAPSGYYTAPQ